MENKFKESRIIEQIMVIGEGEKHAAAFIVPSEENLKIWCKRHNIIFSNMVEIIKNHTVLNKYEKEIESFNALFNPYERIKKFKLMNQPWTVNGGELTATMKLKRKNIINKYQESYKDIYLIKSII